MAELENKPFSNEKAFKLYIKNEVIKNAKKLKGKFLPFSELVNSIPKILTIKKCYELKGQLKNFYLILVNNYSKKPKIRYFLAISLAFQSSDFLVSLAKEHANKNGLKLIQFSIYPKTFRINLLSLKELNNIDDYIEDYSFSLKLLKQFRKDFRKKLINLSNANKKE
ncbi:MAG: hypothetical protein ACTSRI_19705 [Promethearchaeota archaeon]